MRRFQLPACLRIWGHIAVDDLLVDEGDRFLAFWKVIRPSINKHRPWFGVKIDEWFWLGSRQVVRTLHHRPVLVMRFLLFRLLYFGVGPFRTPATAWGRV